MVTVQAFCAHFEYTCKRTGVLVLVRFSVHHRADNCWRVLKLMETAEQHDQAKARKLAEAQQTTSLAVWERSIWRQTSTS